MRGRLRGWGVSVKWILYSIDGVMVGGGGVGRDSTGPTDTCHNQGAG